jgi:hypothetical protein
MFDTSTVEGRKFSNYRQIVAKLDIRGALLLTHLATEIYQTVKDIAEGGSRRVHKTRGNVGIKNSGSATTIFLSEISSFSPNASLGIFKRLRERSISKHQKLIGNINSSLLMSMQGV